MCEVLTNCINAVVATYAVAAYAGMIEDGWHPGICLVTILAAIARGNMIQRLAGCLEAIVA